MLTYKVTLELPGNLGEVDFVLRSRDEDDARSAGDMIARALNNASAHPYVYDASVLEVCVVELVGKE